MGPSTFLPFFSPQARTCLCRLLVHLPLLSLAPGPPLCVFPAGIPQTARILSIWFQTTFSTSSVSIFCLHQPSYRIQDSLNLQKHVTHIRTGAPSSSCLVFPSCLTLLTPWTADCQALLSVEFSMQKYWSGLPFPSPGDIFPTQASNPISCIVKWDLYHWATWETLVSLLLLLLLSHFSRVQLCETP